MTLVRCLGRMRRDAAEEAAMRVECKVLVSEEIAESLPSRPDRVQECLRHAEEAMAETAKERNRHLAEKPQLVDTRSTGLGLVELAFEADTESD